MIPSAGLKRRVDISIHLYADYVCLRRSPLRVCCLNKQRDTLCAHAKLLHVFLSTPRVLLIFFSLLGDLRELEETGIHPLQFLLPPSIIALFLWCWCATWSCRRPLCLLVASCSHGGRAGWSETNGVPANHCAGNKNSKGRLHEADCLVVGGASACGRANAPRRGVRRWRGSMRLQDCELVLLRLASPLRFLLLCSVTIHLYKILPTS
jgi:hypothetical protein